MPLSWGIDNLPNTLKYYTHSIIWGNPYTQPPKKLPRTLIEIQSHNHNPSEKELKKIDKILSRLAANAIHSYYQARLVKN